MSTTCLIHLDCTVLRFQLRLRLRWQCCCTCYSCIALLASARSPCGGGAGLGLDRPRADPGPRPAARWRTFGRPLVLLVGPVAGGRRCGAAKRRATGTLGLGWPDDRSPLVGSLVARARGGWWAAVDEGRVRPCHSSSGTDGQGPPRARLWRN